MLSAKAKFLKDKRCIPLMQIKTYKSILYVIYEHVER